MDTNSHAFEHTTIGSILEYHSTTYPNDLAVVDLEQSIRYTYRELNSRVNQCANMLMNLGARKGHKICVYLNDRVEYLELFYASLKTGLIFIPCNYRFTAKEVIRQLAHSGVDFLVVTSDRSDVAEEIVTTTEITTKIIMVGNNLRCQHVSYGDTVNQFSKLFPNADQTIQSSDHAMIIYTSGTTGTPKGVIHSHKSAIGWAFCSIYEIGCTREDRILNPYPMFHFGGLIMSIQALFIGASNFILGKFDILRFLDSIENEKISVFAAVPTIINALNNLDQTQKNSYKLSSVRIFMTSSAPLYQETYLSFAKQWPHISILSLYTSTEFYFSALRNRDQKRKIRCVGKPAFRNEIKILSPDGKDAQAGESGLIYGRGISLFCGYYQNDEANQAAFMQDWFTCDDIGFFDEEGYLYIVDRAKDMIISGGENISSVEVENLLLEHPDIYECAVIGITDEKWGEKVHAVVCVCEGRDCSTEQILDWTRDKIADYKRPRSLTIVDEIPKNTTGKILKREIRDQLSHQK